ncbi:MAG: lactate racemase domain-containing protein [Myxococcota bacterium]
MRLKDALTKALAEHTFEAANILVAVPDATRPLDMEVVLRPLLERCAWGSKVSIMPAVGLHRPMTPAELAPIERVAAEFGAAVVSHDAYGEQLVCVSEDVGLAPGAAGVLPAVFPRAVAQADLIVCVGLVEPHQYAGFSGGVKTVCIGCAGAQTISAMHGLTYLRDAHTALGVVEGNPFRAALRRLAGVLPEMLALHVVPAEQPYVVFGAVRSSFEQASAHASTSLFRDVEEQVEHVILPVVGSKGANMYQASRAATYAILVDRPAVRKGGWVLVEATCEEGFGEGAGERACAGAMMRGAVALREELATGSRTLSGGEQRAFVIARALARNPIAFIGAPGHPSLDAVGIPCFSSRTEAMGALGLEGAGVRVFEDVFHRVPRHAKG